MLRYSWLMDARTGAERYLAGRLRDPEYRQAYSRARKRIEQVDRVIRALDERREQLELSKAELARRAEMPPEAVRRLFSAERPNPTLQTLASIAEALGLELLPPKQRVDSADRTIRAPSGASGTHRRTA
ncbi:MAG: helix-turn-helix domain-containing protein [Acidimicrobiales bacterium]